MNRRALLGALAGMGLLPRLSADIAPRAKSTESLLVPEEELSPLPSGAIKRLGTLKMRMKGSIQGIRYSSTGKTLVVADRHLIWVVDPLTGEVRHRLKYPEDDLNDGCIGDEAITFFLKVERGQQICKLRQYRFKDGNLAWERVLSTSQTSGTALNRDASFIAQTLDNNLLLYDGKTGNEVWNKKIKAESSAFSPDGARLLALLDQQLQVFEIPSGKLLQTLKPRTGAKLSGEPVGSPDNRWVAAVADRNQDSATVWEVATAKIAHTFRTNGKPLRFSPDSQDLFTTTPSGVAVWNVLTGKKVRSLDVGDPREVMVSPNGLQTVSYSQNAVWFNDAQSGKLLPHSADPPGPPLGLHFVDENTLQAALMNLGGWFRWNLTTGSGLLLRSMETGDLNPLGLSSDGKEATYRDEKSGDLLIRAVGNSQVIRKLAKLDQADKQTASTTDGALVLVPIEETLELIDTKTDRRQRLRSADGLVDLKVSGTVEGTLRLSDDGRWAAAITSEGENNQLLLILDLKSGQLLKRFRLPAKAVHLSVATASPRVVVHFKRKDFSARSQPPFSIIYDAQQPSEMARLLKADSDSNVLGFAPDARSVARTGDDGIELYESITGKLRQRIKTGWETNSVAFSPSGRAIAIAGNGGPVVLWDLLGDRSSILPSPQLVEIEKAWTDLLNPEGATSYRAIQLLARFPQQSLPFLKDRYLSTPVESREKIRGLIQQLGNKSYRLREQAQRELAKITPQPLGEYQRAYDTTESQELRERLGQLLDVHSQLRPEQLRMVRVVEAVEWAATQDAKELLRYWSTEGFARPLSSEAAASFSRLNARLGR